jgi:hypothetical protein
MGGERRDNPVVGTSGDHLDSTTLPRFHLVANYVVDEI